MRGPRAHDPHPLVDLRALAALPLAQRQVGDLVTLGRQALGQVAVPALGPADGVGVEAVVDDAHPHPASISRPSADEHTRTDKRLHLNARCP